MAKFTPLEFTARLIASALAFRQHLEEHAETARLRQLAGTNGEEVPEEIDEEKLWDEFKAGVEDSPAFLLPPNNTDIYCFAGLKEGEPSFTLRGQDILSSMMTRHWIALYEGLAPDARNSKINEAEAIAEKMEMYGKQRWAD